MRFRLMRPRPSSAYRVCHKALTGMVVGWARGSEGFSGDAPLLVDHLMPLPFACGRSVVLSYVAYEGAHHATEIVKKGGEGLTIALGNNFNPAVGEIANPTRQTLLAGQMRDRSAHAHPLHPTGQVGV